MSAAAPQPTTLQSSADFASRTSATAPRVLMVRVTAFIALAAR